MRRAKIQVVCLSALASVSSVAWGQACQWPPAVAESVAVGIGFNVGPAEPNGLLRSRASKTDIAHTDSIGRILAGLFHSPVALDLPMRRDMHDFAMLPLGVTARNGNGTPIPTLDAEFTIGPHGEMQSLTVTTWSRIPTLDSAFAETLRAADSSRSLAGLAIEAASRLRAGLVLTAPSAPNAARGQVLLPLVRLRSVRKGAMARPPEYPAELLDRSIEGEVLLQFVVDTVGRPVISTLRVLVASRRELEDAVVTLLASWRFYPAAINGCTAPQLVQFPFTFRVR